MTIGDIETLRAPLRKQLRQAMEKTAHNEAMVLTVALSYGGRNEIVEVARKILRDGLAGRITPGDITKELFADYLLRPGCPIPICSSGPAANTGSATFSCGSWPTRSFISPMCCGPTFVARTS